MNEQMYNPEDVLLHHPLNIMYLFTILSALICIQLVTIESSDPHGLTPSQKLNLLLQSETAFENQDGSNSNSESDEDYVRRSTSFLRFGRQISPSSGSFLRFGRQISPSSGSFLRFGRSAHNGANFLRFGRRAQPSSQNKFLRFGRKGEFLRFG